MFQNKNTNIKKGFVLVYTLLIGMLCIMLSLFCFEMLLEIRTNVIYSKSYILKVEVDQKGREYLLTEIKEYIIKNTATLTIPSITDLLRNTANTKLVQWQGCYVEKYDLNKNYIAAVLPYDDSNILKEVYQYKIVNGSLKFKYVMSLVVKGGLQK